LELKLIHDFQKLGPETVFFYISYYQNGVQYGTSFQNTDEFIKLAQAFYPGTVITVYFFSSALGLQTDSQTASVLARQVTSQYQSPAPMYEAPTQPSYQAKPTYQAPSYQTSQSTASSVQSQADLNRAIEAIVQSDSRGWWIHTLDAGSVTGTYVRASSADGSVQIARAYYTYSGGRRDWVDVKVSNGKLVCVEYGGELSSCRSVYDPNKSASYAGAIAAAVVLAVVVAAASSSGSSSSGSSSQSSGGDYRPPRSNDTASSNNRPKEDTSVGCAWGDRAYGTCH
jgi:hypothetical protein